VGFGLMLGAALLLAESRRVAEERFVALQPGLDL
jgi:hypothetical protein